MGKVKEFLVSTADVAFIHDGLLAFTGKCALDSSISVSMEDQEITGGKGNKTLYKYKYGRKLTATIEMADWNLAYIAANTGSTIFAGLGEVFAIGECVQLKNGVGTLKHVPIAGKVAVEKADGSIVEVTPVNSTITVGSEDGSVYVTYQYSTAIKKITIDAETSPMIGELIMNADKHNTKKGKVGEIEIHIPSFQLNGTFDISLTAEGNATTSMEGDAIAVEGDSCNDGSVYAYISEIPVDVADVTSISDIAATPAKISLAVGEKKSISVIGLKGGLYGTISLEASECTFTSDKAATATVDADGVVTGVATGEAIIEVVAGESSDFVKVVVA